MALFNSFIFDSSKGETPQTVAMKRAIAAQIMGQMGNRPARNVGEGIGNAFASIGNGIVANVMNRRAGAAQEEGEKGATGLYDSIVSGITNGTPISSGAVPMTDASGEVSATAPGGANYRDAIAGIESAGSGDYAAIGPTHPQLGRALGRYQIMEANIGPWSQAALGRTVTPDEFMANPALQDAIFDNQFNQYVQKYGPEGAAQAWLGGEGGVGKNGRKDSLGTSIGEYGQRFMASLGGAPAAIEAISPTGGSLSDEVADFRNTPEFLQAYPGGYQQQPLTDQQFNDRFGGEPSQANALAASTPQTAGQQALQQQTQANPVHVAQATPQQDMLGGLSVQQLMQAASNPWLNENQRAVVSMLLQQKMQAMDPSHQLDMDYKRAQIAKLQGAANGPAELGLNPQYGVDANGNPVLIQIGKDGKAVQTRMPDGVTLSKEPIKMDAGTHFVLLDPITRQPVGQIPKENEQEAFDKAKGAAVGKSQGEAAAALPGDIQQAEQTISNIDALINHPGLDAVVGPLDQYRGTMMMGAEGRDALTRLKQLQGGAFLQAFGMLKGGGQITEVEGAKAEAAMARMDRALSEDEFRQALKDFRSAVSAGVDKMRQRAGVSAPVSKSGRSTTIGGYTIEQVD